jgi:hypothetical protein
VIRRRRWCAGERQLRLGEELAEPAAARVHFCIKTTRGGVMMQFGTHTVHNCTRGPDGRAMMQERTPPVLPSMPQFARATTTLQG